MTDETLLSIASIVEELDIARAGHSGLMAERIEVLIARILGLIPAVDDALVDRLVANLRFGVETVSTAPGVTRSYLLTTAAELEHESRRIERARDAKEGAA